MSAGQDDKRDIAQLLRDMIAEDCTRIATSLSTATELNADELIHGARKGFKRVRALLRLLRPSIGIEVARSENAFFRDLGQRLAAPRDAFVMMRTFDRATIELQESNTLHDKDLVPLLHHWLSERAGALKQVVVHEHEEHRRVAQDLATFPARFANWPSEPMDESMLNQLLRRQLRRCRRAVPARRADSVAYHEWRKHMKNLWTQLPLIVARDAARLDRLRARLFEVTEIVGREHDLHVLDLFLASAFGEKARSADIALIRAEIARRSRRLRKRARELGGRLFDGPLRKLAPLLPKPEPLWESLRVGPVEIGEPEE
jgi:hypothetical protein